MEDMEDKEVGELWAGVQFSDYDSDGDYYHKTTVQKIIRKLVEERSIWHNEGMKTDRGRYLTYALRDFGIDSKDWH